MTLTRRTFFAGVLWTARPRGVILEAISAPSLPHTLVVPSLDNRSGVFELREYRSASSVARQRLHWAFSRCGIRPLLADGGEHLRYLIRFDSLAARAEAWTVFASDPDWSRIRHAVHLTGVSIYRVACLGRR
jgi:hypothetical protein